MQDVLTRARKIEHHARRIFGIHTLINQQLAHVCNIVVAVVLARHHKHQGTAAGAFVKTPRLIPAAGN